MPDTLGSGMLSMIAMGRAGSPPPVVALATGSDLPWLLVLLAVGALVYRVIQSNLERQRNESINDRLRRLGAGHALVADMKLRWNPILLALAGLACAWFGCPWPTASLASASSCCWWAPGWRGPPGTTRGERPGRRCAWTAMGCTRPNSG